jgi:hypothetical protein
MPQSLDGVNVGATLTSLSEAVASPFIDSVVAPLAVDAEGQLSINLSPYALDSDLTSLAADVAALETGKQDVLTAGSAAGPHVPLLVGSTVQALVAGPHLAAIADDGFVSLHLQPELTGVTIDGKAVGSNIDSIEADVLELTSNKQDVLTVGDPGKAHYPILSGSTIRSLIGGGGIQLVDDGSEAVVVTVQDTITTSLDNLETDVAAHNVLLTQRGRIGSVPLTDPQYGGMKGLYSETPNIQIATVVQTTPSTADIRVRMPADLAGITSLQAATSNGLFLQDNAGNNLVIANATGTSTQDLLVDGVLTSTGNIVVSAGAVLTTNTIRGTDATEVTVEDSMAVTGVLKCITIAPTLGTVNIVSNDLSVQGDLLVSGSVPSPFWIAGKVDGSNLTILSSVGRYGFTVERPAGPYTTIGVYRIRFTPAAPNAHYVVSAIQQKSGTCKVWESEVPGTDYFSLVMYANDGTPVNCVFHFTVYVG